MRTVERHAGDMLDGASPSSVRSGWMGRGDEGNGAATETETPRPALRGTGRLGLTPEDVAALPSAAKAVLRAQLLALFAASLTEPVPPSDPALTPQESVPVVGRSVDWLRRYGPEWHERLIQEFGIGFIMQPVENGNTLYSLAGLELLKRYWRGERASRRAAA